MNKKLALLGLLSLLLGVLAACTADDPQTVELRLLDGDTVIEVLRGTPGEAVLRPDDPVREGATFSGWYRDAVLNAPYTFDVMPDNDRDVFASFIMNEYDLTLEFVERIATGKFAMTASMVLLEVDETLWCWGDNRADFGPCPVESTDNQKTIWPHDWSGSISTFDHHALVIDQDGQVYAWGDNAYGQLGMPTDEDGEDTSLTYFVNITERFQLDADERLVQTVTSETNSYALSSAGRVFAWGLGIGIPTDVPSDALFNRPIDVTDAFSLHEDEVILDIVAAHARAYVLTSEHRLYGWGRNDLGQLGFFSDRTVRGVVELTHYFVSEDAQVLYIDAAYDGLLVLNDQNEVCLVSPEVSSRDEVVRCEVTPYDGSDFTSLIGDLNADAIRDRLITFNGSGALFMATDCDDCPSETVSFAFGRVEPINAGVDGAGTNPIITIVNTPPVASDKKVVMTDTQVCQARDSELWCWGRVAQSENQVITHDVDHASEPDYLDPDDDGDGLLTTLETPNVFAFERRFTLSFEVEHGVDIFTDTTWFEDFDTFIEGAVLDADFFADYRTLFPDLSSGIITDSLTLRIELDAVRFKAGAELSKGVR